MIARLVPPSELGKVYGLLAILDACLPFLALPIATSLWAATLHSLPGAFCYLNAAVRPLIHPDRYSASSVSSFWEFGGFTMGSRLCHPKINESRYTKK